MKFDVVRAWKDETYRQSLCAEELNMLPAHPAGELELTDAELESVSGGGEGIHVQANAATIKKTERIHSYTLLVCDINIYSIQVNLLPSVLSLASPLIQVCDNHD